MLYDLFIAPFAEFEFMRRALVGRDRARARRAAARRFSDVAPHVPDRRRDGARDPARRRDRLSRRRPVAVRHDGGGLIAGFVVAVGAGAVARTTILQEDASLAAFYLISLALGVTIVSLKGSNIDLLHVLFGWCWRSTIRP